MISGLKNITFRYTFIVVIMAVLAILIIVKAGIIMFAERQYWKVKNMFTFLYKKV